MRIHAPWLNDYRVPHTYDVVTFGKCCNLPEPFTPLCEMETIMPNKIVEVAFTFIISSIPPNDSEIGLI